MSKSWDLIDSLLSTYQAKHRHKLSDLYIREQKVVSVEFPEHPAQDAICFKVINKKSSSGGPTLHNVLISRHPAKKVLTMWCGDSTVAKKDREEENYCEFWGKYKKDEEAGYMCKHIVCVMEQQDEKGRKAIEKSLGADTAAPVFSGSIPIALRLNRNILLYGPTGSGKTHMIREHLAGRDDCDIVKINITDGLEDIDLLQKLLPSPDGKGWTRRVGELRTAFDRALGKRVIVVLEELTRSSRALRNLLIKAMDCEGGLYSLHDITTGERVSVPEQNLMYMATANLSYADTSELDPALMRRFHICSFQDYDTAAERKILEGKVGDKTARKLISIAKDLREQFRQGRLPYPLDTGSLITWADLMKDGIGLVEAAGLSWLYRVVEKDQLGYPETGQIEAIMDLLR